jgi:hypothetical protein
MKLTSALTFFATLGGFLLGALRELGLGLGAALLLALFEGLPVPEGPASLEPFLESLDERVLVAAAVRLGGIAQHDARHADDLDVRSACGEFGCKLYCRGATAEEKEIREWKK